jgi:hypothetical protein
MYNMEFSIYKTEEVFPSKTIYKNKIGHYLYLICFDFYGSVYCV